jgi:hypothetical protein
MHPRSHAPSSIWNNLSRSYSVLIILSFSFLLGFAKKTDNRAADHRSLVATGTGQRIDQVLRKSAQTDTTEHDRYAVGQQAAERTTRVVPDLSGGR